MYPILFAFALGFAIGTIGTIVIMSQKSAQTTTIKKVLIIIAVALIAIAGVLIVLPDAEPDTPSEIKCEPPFKNFNSTCSCGPEKELTIQPGGGKICAPMNT